MYQTTNALILRTKTIHEADKQLVLYTSEWGKITAVAPGAKKIRAKLGTATEPLCESEFMLYFAAPEARAKVTGVKVLKHFPKLAVDWRKHVIAQYCSEICEALTPYNSPNQQKYSLLLRTWELLEKSQNPNRIAAAFALRFLKLSGYSFVDYMNRETYIVSSHEKDVIGKLASLSGEDVDTEIEIHPDVEEVITKRIDGYMNLYLPRPLLTRRFLEKVETQEEKQ